MKYETDTPVYLPMYFGDFGGILVPDAFTPDFIAFAEEAKAILSGAAFAPCLERMLRHVPEQRVSTVNLSGKSVQILPSQTLYYMVAGHFALSVLRGTGCSYIGVGNADIALFAARLCHDEGIRCHITLSRALSSDSELIQALGSLEAQVDSTTCAQLYDRPQAYAFQKYLGDRARSGFVPVGSNLGAYPYPALSGIFGGIWGKKQREAVKTPDTVAVTMLHGNAAVAVARGFPDCRLVTVEQPVCQQYHGEFCGCSTLMTRTASYRESPVTLAPELVNLWRMAKVIRLGAEDYCETDPQPGVRAATARAAEIIARRLPDADNLLIVEGEYE